MARGGYRPGSGPRKGTKYRPRLPKPGSAIKKKCSSKIRKAPKIPQDILDDAAAANMTPLDYMLMVMRDTKADAARRDRMAISSAPFCHPRKGEGLGKKEEKSDRAKAVGSGRFSSMANRLKVVK